MTPEEIAGEYEKETGVVIVRAFRDLDPDTVRAVLVAGHGPFAWGRDADDAVHNAAALEYVARMASHTFAVNPGAQPLPRELHDKHFFRKHGAGAYYGQPKG